jgi:hypothetical protein
MSRSKGTARRSSGESEGAAVLLLGAAAEALPFQSLTNSIFSHPAADLVFAQNKSNFVIRRKTE